MKTVGTIAAGIGAAFAFDAIKNATQAAIDFGDSIEHQARATGMSTEAVQKWGYVFKQSGVNIETAEKAFKNLAVEAVSNSQILGVSTTDTNGNLKDMDTLFQELLIKLADIPNPTERAAAAQKAFGKAGQEMFAIASQGKDKINSLLTETDKYGLVLSNSVIKRLDEAKKAQDTMSLSWKVASAELTVGLMPAIEKVMPFVTELARGIAFIFSAGEIENKRREIEEVGVSIALVGEKIKKLEAQPFSFGLPGMMMVNPELTEAKQQLEDLIKKKNELIGFTPATNAPSQLKNEKGKAEKKTSAGDEELNGVSKALSGQVSQMQGDAEMLSDINISLGDSFLKSLNTSQSQLDRYKSLQKEKMDLDINVGKANFLNITKLEKENDDSYAAQLESEEEYYKRKEEMEKKAVDESMQMGEAMGHAIGSGFEKGGYNLHKALKSLLDMLVDAIEKQALAAVASNTLQNVASEGYWGLLVGAGEAAGIEIIAQAARAGIDSFASGTNYAPGGWANVGERGPERVYLPRGSQVLNNHQTTQNTSGHTFNVTINSNGSVAESLHSELRAGMGAPGVQKFIGKLSEMLP
jgi:uncharacterized protein YpiB (UPF0302 family)